MIHSPVKWFVGRSAPSWIKIFTLILSSFTAVFFAATASAWTIFEKKAQPKSSVADLRYGVALYHYYQQDYLQSLSELMVADARDGIQGHADNPELIAGGV